MTKHSSTEVSRSNRAIGCMTNNNQGIEEEKYEKIMLVPTNPNNEHFTTITLIFTLSSDRNCLPYIQQRLLKLRDHQLEPKRV